MGMIGRGTVRWGTTGMEGFMVVLMEVVIEVQHCKSRRGELGEQVEFGWW